MTEKKHITIALSTITYEAICSLKEEKETYSDIIDKILELLDDGNIPEATEDDL